MSKFAVLTSGGDSPGMNAAVASVARNAAACQMPLLGIKRGYNGLLGLSDVPEDDIITLDLNTVLDIADLPGTFLRTARCKPFLDPSVRKQAAEALKALEVDGLVVIGGDGSFHGAQYLCELGMPCVCIPGTIDNDLAYTDITLGYDTAVNECTDAVRSIRATSRSHDRPHVVEVMGRHCGDIALSTAAATGAEILIVPEKNWSVEEVAKQLTRQLDMGNTRATVIVAEGAWKSMTPFDSYSYLKNYDEKLAEYEGQPINTTRLAQVLKFMCNAEVRSTVVGYTQRGCIPTARDGIFAFEAGRMAVDLLKNGQGNQVIGMKDGKIFHMPINEALNTKSIFNEDLYNLINSL